MISKCDVCNIETNHLSDYFCNICQSCKSRHSDIILLKRIGDLLCKIESMERLIESGYDTPDVDVFFDELKAEYKSEGLL